MTNEVTGIGIAMDTDGVERGIKTLKVLAEQGPKVEKAMSGIEGAAKSTGRTLESLAKGAPDLKGVADGAQKAGQALGGMGNQAREAVSSTDSLRRAMGQLSAEEQKYIKGLYDEARQLSMTRGEKAAYIAQSKGMSASAQEVARAIGNKVDALKQEQVAQANAAKSANAMASANEGLASNLQMAVRGVQALVGLQVVAWAKDSAAALFEASAAAERLRIGLDFASARGSADEIAYLRKTTDGLGLAFQSTANSYMQFQAAAKGTTLEGEKARAVFESVAKASAVMGLSAEQNSGVLLALQQMVSKGTVQAEELRGQLGERLPGAFQIAARAMGVTTAELGKMLEMGQVISEDFLPKFATELEKSLGGAAESAANRLDAAANRFDNAWERLKQKAGDSGVSKAMAAEMNAIARDMTAIEETIARASAEGAGAISSLGQGAAVAAGRMGFATLNLAANTLTGAINLLTGGILDLQTNMALLPDALKTNAEQLAILSDKSADAEEQLKHLQSLGDQFGSERWYKNEIARATAVADEYRKAFAEKQALMNGGASAAAYTEGMGNSSAIIGQRKALEDQAKAAIEATKSFKSLSERMGEVRKSGDTARVALAALEAAGQGTSEQAKLLRDRIQGVDDQLKKMAKSGSGGASALTQQANAYQALADKAAEYVRSLQIQAQQGSKLTQSQKLQIELDSLLAKGKGKVSAAAVSQIQASIAIAKAMEGEALSVKRAQEAYQDYLQDQEDWGKYLREVEDARTAMRKAVVDQNIALDDELRLLELEASLMGVTSAARQVAIDKMRIQIELEKELRDISNDTKLEGVDKQEAEAAARARAVKKIAIAERKAYVSEWEKTSQLIGDTLADYIMSGGKDAATYLKRLFSTLVLQPVVQTMVGGIMGTGVAGASGAATGATGGGFGGLMSAGKNLYSAFTSPMFSNFGMGLASNIQQLGGTLFANGFESFGTSVVDFGNAMTGFADAINLAGDVFGYGSAIYNLSQGKFGAAVGSAIGTYFGGPIGAAIGSTLGGLVDGMFGGVTPHAGAASIYRNGAASGNAATAQNLVNAGDSYIAAMQAPLNNLALIVGSSFDSLAKEYGKKSGYVVGTGFTSDNNDPSSGFFQLSTPDGENLSRWTISRKDPKYTSRGAKGYSSDSAQGYDEYLKDVALASLGGILDIVPDWADDMARSVTASLGKASGKDAMQAFSDLVQQIFAIEAAFTSLGEVMPMFADITDGVKTTLIKVSGSFDALNANAQSFYANFYTAEEKLQDRVNALSDVFQKYGAELPTTAEQYRALVEQQMAAGDAGAEFAAVLLGLNGAFKEVADAWKTELDSMSSSVTSFFEDLHGQIQSVSDAVASDRNSILRGSDVMSAEAIAAAIAGTAIMSPSLAGVTATGSAADMARDLVQQRKAGADTAQGGADEQQEKLDAAKAARDSVADRLSAADARIAYLKWDSSRLWDGGSKSGYSLSKRKRWQQDIDAAMANQVTLREQLQAQLQPLEGDVTQQQAVYDEFVAAAKAAAEKLAEAQKALADANKAQEQAKVDYASDVAQWVIDAEGSVSKLSDLRGEVVSFYEAQAQAVQAMLQSAGNIRGVVDQVRLSQLSPEQTAQELGARYAMDYSMALATTGSARAGYVDAMAGNLQGLSESMRAQAGSSAEWQISVGKLLAQASNAAGLLEGDAEADDYEDVALGLLGSIDTALEGLSTATKSAEQVIAEAIEAGTQAQLEGLRAIVAALTGQSIPGFAVGTNYVTQDMTARIHQGEAIIPKAFNPWAGGKMPMGGGDSAAVVAQQREHREEQRAQAAAIVRLLQDGNRILARWESQGMPEERQENA